MPPNTSRVLGKPKVSVRHLVTIAAMVFLAIAVFIFISVPKLSLGLIQGECGSCDNASAIKIALQIGRLDVVSFALGIVGIGLGFLQFLPFLLSKMKLGVTLKA